MLSSDYLPNIGGIAAHVFHLSKALQALGHHITVVNPVAEHRDACVFSSEHGIQVLRVRYKKHNKLTRRWQSNRAARLGIKMALQEHGPFDLIHQHDHISSTFAAAAFAGKFPWLWTNHTSDFLIDYDKPFKKKVVKYAYKECAGIITVSQEIYQKSRILWSLPLTYIPNGVDTERFKPDARAGSSGKNTLTKFNVLCPRRMVPKNGVVYLARAVAEVLQARPDVDWRFTFLGSEAADNTNSSYIHEIKQTLASGYQTGHVSYLGNLPMEEMPKVNALADIVVMPSLMEAVSLSALEAMATGKPVIATNVGGLPEIIHHETTGLLVEPKNPRALAAAVVRLYDDAELRARVAEGGYNLATRHYSWRTVAEQTEQFYARFVKTSAQ